MRRYAPSGILYIDSVDTANIAALAMAINTVYGQG